jgi:hypothetical protein
MTIETMGYTIELEHDGETVGIASSDVDRLLNWSKNRTPETLHGLLETVLYGDEANYWHRAFETLEDEGVEVHAYDLFWQSGEWSRAQSEIALLK